MPNTSNERQAAMATMVAWREARDAAKPGTKEYQSFDEEYQKAQAAVNKLSE